MEKVQHPTAWRLANSARGVALSFFRIAYISKRKPNKAEYHRVVWRKSKGAFRDGANALDLLRIGWAGKGGVGEGVGERSMRGCIVRRDGDSPLCFLDGVHSRGGVPLAIRYKLRAVASQAVMSPGFFSARSISRL